MWCGATDLSISIFFLKLYNIKLPSNEAFSISDISPIYLKK